MLITWLAAVAEEMNKYGPPARSLCFINSALFIAWSMLECSFYETLENIEFCQKNCVLEHSYYRSNFELFVQHIYKEKEKTAFQKGSVIEISYVLKKLYFKKQNCTRSLNVAYRNLTAE